MHWLESRFELGRAGASANLRPMEGLRGVAVLLVFLVHYGDLMAPLVAAAPLARAAAQVVADVGNSGVDLFFMLSGYLIYGALLAREQRVAGFLMRRVVRIYPTFTVVFSLYVAMSLAFPSQSKLPPGGMPTLLYLAENFLLLPGLLPITPMIRVAWSLSYEMFFYLLLPLVVVTLRVRARTARVRTGLFLAAAIAMLGWCTVFGGPARMVMFIGGMLLVEAMRWPRMRVPGSASAFSVLAASLAVSCAHPGFAASAACLCVGYGMVCLVSFRHPDALLARALTWTPLRWLGNMSYSYYLLHGLLLKGVGMLLPATMHGGVALYLMLLAPSFALTLPPAVLLFLAVELPYSLAVTGGSRPRLYWPFAGAARARRR
jgi:exopolysaccharide production protein ExoZ